MKTNMMRVKLHNGAHFRAESVVVEVGSLRFLSPDISPDQYSLVALCVITTDSVLRSNGPEVLSVTLFDDAVAAITLH